MIVDDPDTCCLGSFCGRFHMDQGFNCPHLNHSNLFSNWINIYIYKIVINIDSRGQPYVTLSLLSTANATALPATSGARGTECYRRSVGI